LVDKNTEIAGRDGDKKRYRISDWREDIKKRLASGRFIGYPLRKACVSYGNITLARIDIMIILASTNMASTWIG